MSNSPAHLALRCDGASLFSSSSGWLYPLMELERFLSTNAVDIGRCTVYDKIVGKAAALLAVRLGVRKLECDVLSEQAEPVLNANGVTYTAARRTPRIDCQTEEILADEEDPEAAYRLIRSRIASARGDA